MSNYNVHILIADLLLYVQLLNNDLFLQLHYKLPENGNHTAHARRVFHFNATLLVRRTISYWRVQANNTYYKEKLGQPMNKNLKSSSIYLTEEQYFQVKHFCVLQPYVDVDVGLIEKYSLCGGKDSMVAG